MEGGWVECPQAPSQPLLESSAVRCSNGSLVVPLAKGVEDGVFLQVKNSYRLSAEEKKKLRKALTSIEKLRRLRNGSTGQYVGIFYKKVDQIMVSNPLFPKSFLAHFREQVHSLTSMLLRDGEDGGEEQPPINPRMIRYEIQDWLNLLCDFHEPRPLFSARLLEVGFAQMLDGLMPDLSERPGGANQYQRLVAKSIADAKAQLLRPTMTSRQSMSRSRWSPRSSSSSLGLGSGDAGYLLLS